jgi:hypothetical protein
MITEERILIEAATLMTEDNSNPEYDRAILELTGYSLGYSMCEPKSREEVLKRIKIRQI